MTFQKKTIVKRDKFVQVNLDESTPIFGDAIEHFATNCLSLCKGTVFAIEKIVLHQFFALAVAKMVDVARFLSAGQHNIFFVGFFNCRRLHKIFFGLFFLLFFFIGCFIFDVFNFWDEVSQNA